jgi:hypothetical protein
MVHINASLQIEGQHEIDCSLGTFQQFVIFCSLLGMVHQVGCTGRKMQSASAACCKMEHQVAAQLNEDAISRLAACCKWCTDLLHKKEDAIGFCSLMLQIVHQLVAAQERGYSWLLQLVANGAPRCST